MIERPKSAELCDMIAEQYTRAEFVLFNCVLTKLFLPLPQVQFDVHCKCSLYLTHFTMPQIHYTEKPLRELRGLSLCKFYVVQKEISIT